MFPSLKACDLERLKKVRNMKGQLTNEDVVDLTIPYELYNEVALMSIKT